MLKRVVSLFQKNSEPDFSDLGEKSYFISIAVHEGNEVVYEARTPVTVQKDRLSAVQTLEDSVREKWKSLMWAFHTTQKIERSKRLDTEKGNSNGD